MQSRTRFLLTPLSGLYRAVTRSRVVLYRAGLLSTTTISAPVISVGNLTTGGTGKTPFVSWLAKRLGNAGKRVCILTRGYGRVDSSKQVIVSDGRQVLAKASDGGDEPLLLAEHLLGVAAVISNTNRIAAARWAIDNLKSEVFILDDGFQHLAISRDLNILLIDATNPWGGGKLLPRGRLRELPRELRRADVVIITRSNLVSDVEALLNEVQHLSEGRPVFLSTVETVRLRKISERDTSVEIVDTECRLQPAAAFCAIGNPEAFFAQLRADGFKLVLSESFRDHHVYSQLDIDQIVVSAQSLGAHFLITTAKDEVKLRQFHFELPCFVLDIEMKLLDESYLVELVTKAIQIRATT